MKIIYRPLNIQDEEEIKYVIEMDSTVPTQFDDWQHVSEEWKIKRLEELKELKEKDFFQVAEFESKIVGFHYVTVSKWNFEVGSIITTWIHPDFRGKKIAQTLKIKGEEWLKSKGVKYLCTGVHIDNTKMRAINEKSGFVLRTNGYAKML